MVGLMTMDVAPLAEALRALVDAQFQADRILDRARGGARAALAAYDAAVGKQTPQEEGQNVKQSSDAL
jgi:hypothetical protein